MRTLFILALLVLGVSVPAESRASFTSPANLSGYAWSSNVGWINFRGTGYGVQINTDFTITGYAWSSNVGWIRFGGMTGCPGGGNCNARVNPATDALAGWARVCSASAAGNCTDPLHADGGGWTGWISLSGTASNGSTYGVVANNGRLEGYAWGGEVVGWISFNSGSGVTYTPPCTAADIVCTADLSGREVPNQWCTSTTIVSCIYGAECNPASNACEALPITALITVSPAAIRQGETATVTWSSTNASSCTLEQQFPGGQVIQSWNGTSSTETSAPIQGLTLFALECSDAFGANLQQVASTSIRIIPNLIET